ncbi:MAG: telomere resolvase [Hassallia sp. WJT32-NPBG1]|nr:telomere resolvase [Hassallia sp. WJT32-NPBG1]
MTTETDFAKELVSTWKESQATQNEKLRKTLWQQCFDMCDTKQKELFKNYAKSTVIKVHTPKYRKAIAVEADKLDEKLKGGYSYTSYPMAFWKVDQELRSGIDSITKVRTGSKKKDSVRVPVECREKLLTLANDLLETPTTSAQSIFKKALAISLLTGRRFYVEICRNAQFYELEEVTDFNRTLGFIGQAKGGIEKAEQIYELPTYAENIDLLIENTELVQSFVKSKDWYRDAISAQTFQSKIKSQCELALRPFNEVTMPYSFALTIKDLRALYMAFCYYNYRVLSGKHPDIDTYIGSIAGHDVQTESGTYYRAGTTEHYKAFIDERWDN